MTGIQASLNKNVAVCFDVSPSIVWHVRQCLISARVPIILPSGARRTKSNSRITRIAISFVVTYNSNSGNGRARWSCWRYYIKSLHVAIKLEWRITQKRFPLVSADVCFSVLVVCQKWVKRGCLLINRYPFCLLANSHSKANFIKRVTPVAWHLRLFKIKLSFTRSLTISCLVAPKVCMIGKCSLTGKVEIKLMKNTLVCYRN